MLFHLTRRALWLGLMLSSVGCESAVTSDEPLSAPEGVMESDELASTEPRASGSDPSNLSAMAKERSECARFLSELGATEPDEQQFDAASHLLTLGRGGGDLVCGAVEHVATTEGLMEGTTFPRTDFVVNGVEISAWGSVDPNGRQTSATPNVEVGKEMCVHYTESEGRNWISGKGATFRMSHGKVQIGSLIARADALRTALSKATALIDGTLERAPSGTDAIPGARQ